MYTEQLQNAAEIAVTTLVAIMQTGKSEHARVAACRLVLQMAAKQTADSRVPAERVGKAEDSRPKTEEGREPAASGNPARTLTLRSEMQAVREAGDILDRYTAFLHGGAAPELSPGRKPALTLPAPGGKRR